MDGKVFEANLDTLKDMILDEQKLVTYVSLSRDLGVHVNESKLLLNQLISDFRKKQSDTTLYVNYIISGLYDDNKARTTVCSEEKIDILRKSFKIVFFEHIYSISKCGPFVDNVAFLAVNKLEDFILCTGLIKNTFCVKHTQDEIGNLKLHCQDIVDKEQKPINPPQKKIKEEKDLTKNGNGNTTKVTKIQETKSEPILKKISPKKDLNSNTKQKSDKKSNNKTQKGIAGFFNKVNNTSKKVTKDNILKNEETVIKTEKEEIKETKVESMDIDDNPIKKEQNNGNYSNKRSKENESSHQLKKNLKLDKKRKRVLCVSDSESEDENSDPFVNQELTVNCESEDEIPPTPSVDTMKISSGIINPRKKRKMVDKTYTDEDGYILTKKEEVYESCSENEEENVKRVNHVKNEITTKESTTNEKKGNKKKLSSPQKGKQATLMNFFKKI